MLGFGLGMFFGKAMNLPHGDDTFRHAGKQRKRLVSMDSLGSLPDISTKAGQE